MADGQKVIDNTYHDVRQYFPGLLQRLLITYIVPIVLAMVFTIIGGQLLIAFTGDAGSANMTAFLVNVIILMTVWRFLERRTQATGLFVQYTRYSRQRRDLKKSEAMPAEDLDTLRQLARDFIESAQQAGISPQDAQTRTTT